MVPGRQMVVIRLDATKRTFWNFRSPEKTCQSASPSPQPLCHPVMQAARSVGAVHPHLRVRHPRTGTGLPLSPTAFSQKAHLPVTSLVIHLFIQQPFDEQRC